MSRNVFDPYIKLAQNGIIQSKMTPTLEMRLNAFYANHI